MSFILPPSFYSCPGVPSWRGSGLPRLPVTLKPRDQRRSVERRRGRKRNGRGIKKGGCEERSREDKQNGINIEMDEEKNEEEHNQQLQWTRFPAETAVKPRRC